MNSDMMFYVAEKQLALLEELSTPLAALGVVDSERKEPSVKVKGVLLSQIKKREPLHPVLPRFKYCFHEHGSPNFCTAFLIRYPVSHAPSSLP